MTGVRYWQDCMYMFWCTMRAREVRNARKQVCMQCKSLGCNAKTRCLLYPFTLDFASMFAFGYFNAKTGRDMTCKNLCCAVQLC